VTPPPRDRTLAAEHAPNLHGTAGRRSGPLAYLWCIRYAEVLVLQGSPLLGAAFAIGSPTPETVGHLLGFVVASFLLVAHIFSFNDWAGAVADSNDPNKSARVFSTKGVSPRQLLLFSLGLLVAALLVFIASPLRTLLLALVIAALGIFYSHPRLNAKGVPLLSSTPHLLGGLLHFLLGYSLFRPIDTRGMLIALFFSLTFTAGHLNQEVRDHEGDRLNGLGTNAVRFGARAAFLAGFAMFTLAYGDLAVLAIAGIVPASLGVLAAVLYPIHAYWSLATLRGGLTFDRVRRFQGRYRALYALIGLGMLATLLYR
jgi:4-hydroxybenzoate polyprenyltransferase